MSAPLRIAVFAHEFPAVSETFVLGEITGLLDRGCDVWIFARAPREEALRHPDVSTRGLSGLCRYLAMPARRWRRLGQAFRILLRHGARRPRMVLGALNAFRYGRAAVSLELLFWVCRLQEAGCRFDVIHCHFGTVGRIVAFLREIGAIDGALVTTFHGVDVSRSLRHRPGLYRHLFAQGDLFLPVSQYWKETLIQHGCDPRRLRVHHMGVDPCRFHFRTRGPDAEGALRLLTVGRLVEKKGVEQALRAVSMARGAGVRLRYTVIGDGPLRARLEATADALGIRDAVTFAGWRSQADIADAMYAHDVLLAPSLTDTDGDQEGIPVTLMEAMATGMPVISTVHTGIPELVEDGVSGRLVPEGDIDGLSDAIVLFARNRHLVVRMGRHAWAAVSAGFNARKQLDRLLALFIELAGETVPAPSAEPARVAQAIDS